MEDVSIEVKDLKIFYRVLTRMSIKKSLLKFHRNKIIKKEAIKGLSFRVKKGEVVGIIGKNGCGKSTLLRAIAGIISPDEGSIDLKGNSVSLLAIGVGFNEELSGYDNIFLSGMLLGIEKEQVKEKLNEIIDFSELENDIYKPVRTYSSGMRSKLAFSITDKSKTVLLVSHDTSVLLELCDYMIWISDGIIKKEGNTHEVITAYEAFMKKE